MGAVRGRGTVSACRTRSPRTGPARSRGISVYMILGRAGVPSGQTGRNGYAGPWEGRLRLVARWREGGELLRGLNRGGLGSRLWVKKGQVPAKAGDAADISPVRVRNTARNRGLA